MHVQHLISNPDTAQLAYFGVISAGLCLSWSILRTEKRSVLHFMGATIGYAFLAIAAALMFAVDGFQFLTFVDWGLFAGGLLGCLMGAWFSGRRFKVLRAFYALSACALLLIAVDAFLVEPHALQVREVTLKSSKLRKPLVIGIVSDIQTDHVSDYERQVFTKLMAAHPDLVLLPGDFVQAMSPARSKEIKALNNLFRDVQLGGPSGAYAVRGNVDDNAWPEIFSGLPVHAFTTSDSVVARDDVRVYGLSFDDSFDDHLKLSAPSDKFSIVFGHGPDFSLGDVHADLLVAGHTHGGQVQVPFMGPPLTFTRVPNTWAAGGVFDVRPGTRLILTRGAGMERFNAPRMRFFCRPEIVIAHVLPE